MEALPFFFRYHDSSKSYFLSNQAGSFAFLEKRDELIALVEGDYSKLETPKLEELTAKLFLCEDRDFKVAAKSISSKLALSFSNAISPPELVMICPTLRCDHNCVYCQVSRVPIDKQGYDLDDAKLENIVQSIAKLPSDNIKIEFQGGEPLAAFPTIEKIVALAESRLSNKSIDYVICTALGPLNERIVSWIKGKNIQLSISLDGPKDLHIKNRPSNHFNSYENTASKIRWLIEELGHNRVSCLTTVTAESLKYPKEIVDSYIELGLTSVFCRPLSPFGFAQASMKYLGYTAQEYISFYKKQLDYIVTLNKQSEDMIVDEWTAILLQRIFRPHLPGYVDLSSPSGHVFGALVFNYDGKVFGSDEARMLWESTKEEALVSGRIDHSPLSSLSNNNTIGLLSDTIIQLTPGCDECAYQPYCGADPMHHLSEQADHIGDKAVSFHCELQKGYFEHIFEILRTSSTRSGVLHSWLAR